MITSKQKNYICWLIEGNLPELFKRIPKNNKYYTNEKADYRRMILADRLKYLNNNYAQTLIKLIEDRKEEAVEQFIFGLEGIK